MSSSYNTREGSETAATVLAHDDNGGSGHLVILVPGAGDVRSEYRSLVGPLAAGGYRVITADLPGHGESAPASEYTVESTSDALLRLIVSLDAGPAVVVGASFAPAAAVWAAKERPDLVDGLVLISPHLEADSSVKGLVQRLAISASLRGPWASGLWARLYTGWYKATTPADLGIEVGKLRSMLADTKRRRAVRETLIAGREGVARAIAEIDLPTLTIFGSADDHFADPTAEALSISGRLGGGHLMVPGAGHYPHVEQPELAADAILGFLAEIV